jgi:1,4-dihydroxy-2-naphthoyl-CoA synthase
MPLPVVPILPPPLVSRAPRAPCPGHVEGQDQRAGLADEQARAHVEAQRLQALDLEQQVRRVDHHAVADVAGHAVAHDARGDQLQRRLRR